MSSLEVMDFLEHYHPVSPGLRAALRPLLVVEHYKKNQVIYSPSSNSKKVWFVQSGYLCLYQIEESINISDLYKKGSVILFCFTCERADSYLKVMTDCTLTTIDYRTLVPLFKDGLISPEMEKLMFLNEINRKILAARSAQMPGKKRLQQLLSDIPEIFMIASYDEICSYLKVSRETLRKFRNAL